MHTQLPDCLLTLARKYIWWMPPEVAVTMPDRLIAQVMNLGDFDDVQVLATLAGESTLRRVLTQAEIGQFTPRSWAYWHYRLGLAEPGQVPAMPRRIVA